VKRRKVRRKGGQDDGTVVSPFSKEREREGGGKGSLSIVVDN